jgi:hypothetical protein
VAARSSPKQPSQGASRKKLDRPAVQKRIAELLAEGPPEELRQSNEFNLAMATIPMRAVTPG